MGKQLAEIIEQLRGLWRFRWHMVVVSWIAALLGFFVVYLIPDSFESKATVYVDTDSVLKPLLQGLAYQRDSASQISMMSSVLLSRPTLERVSRESRLDQRTASKAEFEKLLDQLADKIGLDSGGRSNTFKISYSDKDPAMARRVVQSLLTVFMEDTVGIKGADTGMASKFLGDQIKEYEKRLVEAEDALADFKKKNVGLMPGQSGDYYTRLQNLMASIETLRSRNNQLVSRREELRRQLSGESPTYSSKDSLMPSAIDEQISQYNARLNELLNQYTEKHPEVVALREQINRLEKERVTERPGSRGPSVVTTLSADGRAVPVVNVNPVYQNLRLTVAQTEAEMAELRGQIADQERQVAELRTKVNTAPEVEARLAQLTRNYEVNKAQHAALLQRFESARISGEADESADKVKFRLIEPPLVPTLPIGPKRPLLLTGALLVSLAAGVGLAFGLNQIRPVFSSPEAVQKALGIQLIGSISIIEQEPRGWYRSSVPMFSASICLLFCVYIASILGAQKLGPAARAMLGM